MTNDNELTGKFDSGIAFDAASGISEDEQREILADINGIAEKNRRSLSCAAPEETFKAAKKGGLFPLLVNLMAVVFLAGGFLLLSSIHGKEDVRLREGAKVFNSAERALINQIREDTLLQVEAKENEINRIIAKMGEVDHQLEALYSTNLELTVEQRATEENLMKMQEEYRMNLSTLQDERSGILANARAREAALQAQLEARTRELIAVSEQKEAALNIAQSELERLGTEQEKASAIEATLAASFAFAGECVRNGELTRASEILLQIRQFLNTPAFQGIRSLQARKDLYIRSIALMEALVEDARKNHSTAVTVSPAAPGNDNANDKAINDLLADKARLEETIAGLNRSIAAMSSQGSGAAQRLVELENSGAALRNINAALEALIDDRNKAVSELEAKNTSLVQMVSTRDNEIKELRTENQSLDTQLTSLRQAIQALSQ